MSNPSDRKSLLIIFSVLFFIVCGTYLISMFARGYQLDFQSGPSLKATGLLSATSKPKSASVYINDRLLTATDDTVNLPPGDYKIKIAKDGYLPWEKDVKIKKEVVFQTDAQLYRSVPDLRPLTFTGAIHPSVSPDGTKIVYAVASASASRDNGLYLIELNDNPLLLNKSVPKQLANNFPGVDWSKFTYTFSPNSRNILASNSVANISYLLPLDSPISLNTLYDVTARLSIINEEWNNQSSQIIASKLLKVPQELRPLISTDSAKNIAFSTTEDKILYLTKTDGNLQDHLITPPPAQSTQTQSRQIKKDNYYVYDIKDDTNFLIGSKQEIYNPTWLLNSDTIVYVDKESIKVVEYDATNKQTLFAGSFNKDIAYPWSDGSRIVTFTSAYSGAPENLYTISIK